MIYENRKPKRSGRRSVLRRIGANIGGLGITGIAAGQENVRYIAAGDPLSSRLSKRINSAGFSIVHEIFDGNVLIITGRSGQRAQLTDIQGVLHVVEDRLLRTRSPGITRGSTSPAPSWETSNLEQPVTQIKWDNDEEFVSRQWDKEAINAFEAHRTATGEGTCIAIIDDGILADHPDLEKNFNLDASVRINRGQLFPSRGLNGYGHGTIVAGVAAASNDGDKGIVGVAPDAELVSVSPTFGGGTPLNEVAFLTDVILSMDYANNINADVMNLSLGALYDLPPEIIRFLRIVINHLAFFTYPQTVVVIASGNDGINITPEGGFFDFPASIPSALTVGATGPNDERSDYSTYGQGFVDVTAPGGEYEMLSKTFCENDGDGDETGRISSDWAGYAKLGIGPPPKGRVGKTCPLPEYPYPTNGIFGTIAPNSVIAQEQRQINSHLVSQDGYYAYLGGGTSFAAPQVAGVVALIREVAPNMPARRIQEVIRETAEVTLGESRSELGAGRINAARAVAAARKRNQ
jgi:subtilisin family serine protease